MSEMTWAQLQIYFAELPDIGQKVGGEQGAIVAATRQEAKAAWMREMIQQANGV